MDEGSIGSLCDKDVLVKVLRQQDCTLQKSNVQ